MGRCGSQRLLPVTVLLGHRHQKDVSRERREKPRESDGTDQGTKDGKDEERAAGES